MADGGGCEGGPGGAGGGRRPGGDPSGPQDAAGSRQTGAHVQECPQYHVCYTLRCGMLTGRT